jgi:hypothetical protein
MKTLLLTIALFILILYGCTTQKKLTLRYIAQRYTRTVNKSFLNNELLFLNGKDTLRMNVKLPYNPVASDTVNTGIYRRCHLKKDRVYSFKLKPVNGKDIPDVLNSYYKLNAIFSSEKRNATYTEVKKDTEFLQRNPGSFIDMNGQVYEIMELMPDQDCDYE